MKYCDVVLNSLLQKHIFFVHLSITRKIKLATQPALFCLRSGNITFSANDTCNRSTQTGKETRGLPVGHLSLMRFQYTVVFKKAPNCAVTSKYLIILNCSITCNPNEYYCSLSYHNIIRQFFSGKQTQKSHVTSTPHF